MRDHRSTMKPRAKVITPKDRRPKEKRGSPDYMPKIDMTALNLKRWEAIIDVQSDESTMTDVRKSILPALEVSNHLMAHANAQVAAITAMMKSETPPESVGELTKRMGPVIALKEVIDIYISQQCERVLDTLEESQSDGSQSTATAP